MKDATEDVKEWKEMKEARDELAQGKGNYKTKPENERERKKNVKEERKIRNRSS